MSPPDKAFPPSHFPARGGLPSRHDVRVPCFAPQETAAGISAPSKREHGPSYIRHTGTGDWNNRGIPKSRTRCRMPLRTKPFPPIAHPHHDTHAPSSGTAYRNGTHTKLRTDRRRTAPEDETYPALYPAGDLAYRKNESPPSVTGRRTACAVHTTTLLLHDTHGHNPVARTDCIDNIESFDHFAETRMYPVEVLRVLPVAADEELRTARISTAVRHG